MGDGEAMMIAAVNWLELVSMAGCIDAEKRTVVEMANKTHRLFSEARARPSPEQGELLTDDGWGLGVDLECEHFRNGGGGGEL